MYPLKIAGIINNILSTSPNIISCKIFFILILKIYAISTGKKPSPKITKLTSLPSLIEKNAIISVMIHKMTTIAVSMTFLFLFFTIISSIFSFCYLNWLQLYLKIKFKIIIKLTSF